MKILPLNEMSDVKLRLDKYPPILNPAVGPVLGIMLHDSADESDLNGYICNITSTSLNRLLDTVQKYTKSTALAKDEQERERWFVPAGGKSLSLSGAVLGGLGEFIERYYAALAFFQAFRSGHIVYATPKELDSKGYNHLGPEDIKLFAESQYRDKSFPFEPFTQDSYIGWVAAKYLDGTDVFVPAQLVFMTYKRVKGEALIGYPTSGGLSYGATREESIVHGILEIVERDAINLFWVSRVPAVQVVVKLSDIGFNDVFVDEDSLYILRTWTDMDDIYVIHAQYFNKRTPRFLGGGAIGTDPEETVRTALLETKQSAFSARYIPLRAHFSEQDLTDFFMIIPYYSHPPRMRRLEATIRESCRERVRIGDMLKYGQALSIKGVLDRLASPPIVYDFDLEGLGISVGYLTKTFLPNLTFAGVPRWMFLGHPRFYEIPYKLGLRQEPLSWDQLNHSPLPFP